jgi:uncharacterized protein YciI
MSSILILKPIIDVLYDDVKEYKNKMEKRVKELEEEIASLKAQRKRPVVTPNVVVLDESDDDEAFAEAALAGLTHESVVKQVEIKNEVEDTSSNVQEDTKTVKMIGGKDAKEYMKEYQRNYRKKQKENMINKTN